MHVILGNSTLGSIITSDGEKINYNGGGSQKTNLQWNSGTWTVKAKTSGTYICVCNNNSASYNEVKFNKDDVITTATDSYVRQHGSIIIIRLG